MKKKKKKKGCAWRPSSARVCLFCCCLGGVWVCVQGLWGGAVIGSGRIWRRIRGWQGAEQRGQKKWWSNAQITAPPLGCHTQLAHICRWMWILLDDVIRIFVSPPPSKAVQHIFDFYLDINFNHGHALDTCLHNKNKPHNKPSSHFDNLHVIEVIQVPITTAINFKI